MDDIYIFQVNSIPDIKSTVMSLGGLLTSNATASPSCVSSVAHVLELRKMMARYCLLSWTMCFNTVSQPLAENLGTIEKLKTKGLLTDMEGRVLQVTNVSGNS